MKIAVIGGGVSGYSTAIKLLESGKDVVIYSPEDAAELATTNKACAIWMPFLLGELMTEDLKIDSLQSAMISWQYFSDLEKLPECGISKVTHTEITRQKDDRFAAHLYANFSENSYIDGEQVYKYSHQYQTFVIEIPKYYKWLKERFEYLGGELCLKFLNSEDIKKLPEKIIFNCAGLGARELVGDQLFQPKKGQIILHEPVDVTCSLGVEELAIIPRTDALVIGTLYFTEDGLLENLAQTEKLWDLAEKWSNSEIGKKLGLSGKISRKKRLLGTSTLIGQRPCRDTGYELSAEIMQSHSVYHNYGHGGSGVTLSWGCATKAASLFENNLNKKLQAINPDRSNKGVMQFSVELAHYELSYLVSLGSEELIEVIQKESRQLQMVISKLSLHRKNFSINILIDDKSSDVKEDARHSIVSQLSRLGADFICYESKLFDFIDVLNNKLTLPSRLKQEFKTYSTRHHKLGCAQDIFIWHCLRFGLIDHQAISGAVIPCSKRAITGDCHFAANGILNLLKEDFSPFEERADKYLLDCFGHEVPAAVKRYYA